MIRKLPPLEEMTLRQLRRVASTYGISHYSRMRKAQLLWVIRSVQQPTSIVPASRRLEPQEEVEAAKFNLGQPDTDRSGSLPVGELASVDEGLSYLPEGYGESRIVLMPRDPLWAYVYWDVPNEQREILRRQGGQSLTLRVYDVTDWRANLMRASSGSIEVPQEFQAYPCDELARDWYLPIPVSDRDYVVEIGYTCGDGRWLGLARSIPIHVPPVYPSEWADEHFVEVQWHDQLENRQIYLLQPPDSLSRSLNPLGSPHPLAAHTTGSGHHLQRPSSHHNGSHSSSTDPYLLLDFNGLGSKLAGVTGDRTPIASYSASYTPSHGSSNGSHSASHGSNPGSNSGSNPGSHGQSSTLNGAAHGSGHGNANGSAHGNTNGSANGSASPSPIPSNRPHSPTRNKVTSPPPIPSLGYPLGQGGEPIPAFGMEMEPEGTAWNLGSGGNGFDSPNLAAPPVVQPQRLHPQWSSDRWVNQAQGLGCGVMVAKEASSAAPGALDWSTLVADCKAMVWSAWEWLCRWG